MFVLSTYTLCNVRIKKKCIITARVLPFVYFHPPLFYLPVRLEKIPDAPEVSLVGTPTVDLEENIDSVSLRCVADANPPATVIWRRVGGSPMTKTPSSSNVGGDIYSFQEILEFSPVTRKDSATYSCEAKNTVGTSNLITVPIDIKCKFLR